MNITAPITVNPDEDSAGKKFMLLSATLAIVVYCFLFEWPNYLEFHGIQLGVFLLKLALPIIPLYHIRKFKVLGDPRTFILLLLLLFAWAIVPNSLNGYKIEAFSFWLKYLYRILFFSVCYLYFSKHVEQLALVFKIFVIIAAVALVQYLLLEYSFMNDYGYIEAGTPRGGRYWGPYGLFGQGLGNIWFPYIKLQVFRLYGFWLEPSTASAFLFMSYFLSRAVGIMTNARFWRYLGVCCVAAGFFCFSNAGYFAFGLSLLIGQCIEFYYKRKNRFVLSALIMVSTALIAFSLFGRYISLEILKPFEKRLIESTGSTRENNNIKVKITRNVLVGAIELFNATSGGDRLIGGALVDGKLPQQVDASVGRLKLIRDNLRLLKSSNYLGIGMRVPGKDKNGHGVEVSGTAPVYWMLFTGLPGLILLLLSQSIIVKQVLCKYPPDAFLLRILQAFCVVCFQNLLYGTWMSPLYLFLVATLFILYTHPYPVIQREHAI